MSKFIMRLQRKRRALIPLLASLRRLSARDPCGTGCRRSRGFWLVDLRSLLELLGVGTFGEIALASLPLLALSPDLLESGLPQSCARGFAGSPWLFVIFGPADFSFILICGIVKCRAMPKISKVTAHSQ